MKKIIYSIIIILGLNSCDFLDTDVNNYVSGNPYKDKQSTFKILTGVYDCLGKEATYGESLWSFMDCGNDLMVFNRENQANDQDIRLNNYTNNTAKEWNATWKALYDGINRANDFIDNLSAMPVNTFGSDQKKYLGEAYALRALYYMNLAEFWGGVPLRLHSTQDLSQQLLKKAPLKEVYKQIIADLEMAEASSNPKFATEVDANKSCVNSFDTPGRMNQSAVKALMARCYIWMGGLNSQNKEYSSQEPFTDAEVATFWKAALDKVNEIENLKTHQLFNSLHAEDYDKFRNDLTPYRQYFINLCSDKYDTQYKESLFEVEFYGNGLDVSNEGGKLGQVLGLQCTTTECSDMGYAYALYDATKLLYGKYTSASEQDARTWWNISPILYKINNANLYKDANKLKEKEMSDGKAKMALNAVVVDNAEYVDYTYEELQNKQLEVDRNYIAQGTNDAQRSFAAKFRREYDPIRPIAKTYTSINFPVIRYADVLLMKAECLMHVKEGDYRSLAIDYVNKVRARAYATLREVAKYANDETLLQEIYDERARELCFEGNRKMDLRRWGQTEKAQKTLSALYGESSVRCKAAINFQNAPKKFLFAPIPESELSVNTICGQNPEW
ncbi:MAG: RagB/SusD family nutrient uptake outer membrane protein [Bacteroides sp.]